MEQRTIWKFPFDIQDTLKLQMPEGAEIISVQIQDRAPCMWAVVNPVAPKTERRFEIFGTGHTMRPCGAFVGTLQFYGGGLVFHIFEALSRNNSGSPDGSA